MTRKLSHKAAAAFIRKSFADKGMAITHTESLNMVAHLEGYEAWSHLQQHSKKTPTTTNSPVTFKEFVRDTFGPWHSFPGLPRSDWQHEVADNNTPSGYLDWVFSELAARFGLHVADVVFESPTGVEVTEPGGTESIWKIEQDLTDRWGDLNDALIERKSKLPLLVLEGKFDPLRKLMSGEDTFITYMQGFGILYELEYYCAESDDSGQCFADVKKALLNKLIPFDAEFPKIKFGVPAEEVGYKGRPVVWAFLPEEVAAAMSVEARDDLALRLGTLL